MIYNDLNETSNLAIVELLSKPCGLSIAPSDAQEKDISNGVYIYIYIYIERERERERKKLGPTRNSPNK